MRVHCTVWTVQWCGIRLIFLDISKMSFVLLSTKRKCISLWRIIWFSLYICTFLLLSTAFFFFGSDHMQPFHTKHSVYGCNTQCWYYFIFCLPLNIAWNIVIVSDKLLWCCHPKKGIALLVHIDVERKIENRQYIYIQI